MVATGESLIADLETESSLCLSAIIIVTYPTTIPHRCYLFGNRGCDYGGGGRYRATAGWGYVVGGVHRCGLNHGEVVNSIPIFR